MGLLGAPATPIDAPPPMMAGQPSFADQVAMAGKRDNCLVISSVTTLLCCLPFGGVAINNAARVDWSCNPGQLAEARRLSEAAKEWSTISAVLGVVVIAVYRVFHVLLFSRSEIRLVRS